MAHVPPETGATDRAPAALRRAHAVLKQRTKLVYVVPRLLPLLPGGENGDAAPILTLQQIRAIRRLSIEELARRSRISPSTIYRIEHGKTRPRVHVAHALSAALGVAPRRIAEFRGLIVPHPLGR